MIDLNRISTYLQTPSAAPLHVQLRDALVLQITDGTIKPGEALPSEIALHNQLGVGTAAIRQALQSLIDSGLVQSILGSGNYVLGQPGVSFQTPVVPEHNVVGLVASYPHFHMYYGQMAASFNLHLHQAGWTTEMGVHNDRITDFQQVLDGMWQRGIRVFSITPLMNSHAMAPILDDLRTRGALIQLVGRSADYPMCDYIGTDNELIGVQATQYLIQLGHARIIYMGMTAFSTGAERARGYVRAMREANLPPRLFNLRSQRTVPAPPEFAPYLDSENSAVVLWREVMRHRVTAAFCFNDSDASWMYNEIRKFRLSVPEDISLVSVDNLPITEYEGIAVPPGYVDVPLTTFAQPGEEVGRRAAELLLRRLAGEDFPRQDIRVPALFIQRTSAAAPRH